MLNLQMFLTNEDKKRFWSKVHIAGPNDCWEWQAQKDPNGYGRFQLNYKSENAHRISYQIEKGIKDFSSVIQHNCDNPSCVNPSHLLEGTQSDNIQACSDRNRLVGNRKLTELQVRAIKWTLINKNKYGLITQLANFYNVNRRAIQDIKCGKSWRHVNI